MERAVRVEREPVFYAAPRSAPPGRGGSARLPHVCGPSGPVHGPHPDLPGAGGEAQGATCRLR